LAGQAQEVSFQIGGGKNTAPASERLGSCGHNAVGRSIPHQTPTSADFQPTGLGRSSLKYDPVAARIKPVCASKTRRVGQEGDAPGGSGAPWWTFIRWCELNPLTGAIRRRELGYERDSSSPSKTLRAAMGRSIHSIGCVKRAKECWNESHTVNVSACAAKTKENPAG
jgi:hypothetical protein